ncbi:extracellular solute-binding protein [Micromonospora deserti]|nr:extracellular solute-binding protein [Micromonospora deserti]
MRGQRSNLLACGVVAALVLPAAACAGQTTSDDDGKVKITVAGLFPTTQEKNRQAFLNEVKAFEKANPTVDITPTESKWEAKTFAARLAGGQLETVFLVPLTEPQGLIKRRQIAEITEEMKRLPHVADFDQRALAPATGQDGKVYGLPTSMFALGLIYNRDLFTKAGLDPDSPPKTWEEVRTAAKAISDRTGLPGFAQPTTNNTGGWTLSAITYTYGGRIEKEQDGSFVPAFTEGPTQRALEWLAAMRWQDKSMGTQHLRNAGDLQQDFAAGKIGMMVATPSTYGDHVTKFNGDPKLFGVAALPSAGTLATLTGGSMAVVNPKASAAQREAAVKWIDHYYLRPRYDTTVAAQRAQADASDKVPVGMPRVPFYSAAVSGPIQEVERKNANVPLDNFKPYEQGVAAQQFMTEPPVAAQDLYAALDTALQAVLTRAGADIAAELRKAEEKVQPALERAQQ